MIDKNNVKAGDQVYEIDLDHDNRNMQVIRLGVEKVTPTTVVLRTQLYGERPAKYGLTRCVSRSTIGARYRGSEREALAAYAEIQEREINNRRSEIARCEERLKWARERLEKEQK